MAKEYGVTKIDASNCISCQQGGKGEAIEVFPQQDLNFFTLGMMNFFKHTKEKMLRDGYTKEDFKEFFRGIKGIVLLDTLGNDAQLKAELEKLETDLRLRKQDGWVAMAQRTLFKKQLKKNRV